MGVSFLYCPTCGAANGPAEQICFACQETLAVPPTEDGLLQGRYRLLAQVGSGGFGAVYKALDMHHEQKPVAIKQIHLRGLSPQEMIDATDGFNREVQILSHLSHPHLPQIHEHFTDPDHWYLVMDFIDGVTLEEYLQNPATPQGLIRSLLLDEVLDIGLQLCEVLAYLHSRQPPVIFRDLKPANLMRTRDGRIYVIDFGIARSFKPGQSKDTGPLGSPGYAAPEQYGRAQTDPRADIYSLGALLHFLLSRQDPADQPFIFAPLHSLGPVGEQELAALITRMVEKDAALRPPTIESVASSLRHCRGLRTAAQPRIWRPQPGEDPPAPGSPQLLQFQQQIARAARPTRLTGRPGKKKKSRRTFLIAGLSTLGALALTGGFVSWKSHHPSRISLADGFPQQLPALSSSISGIAWTPDGQYLAVGAADGRLVGYARNVQNRLDHFFTQTAEYLRPGISPSSLRQPGIQHLAWSSNDDSLAIIFSDGDAITWTIGETSPFVPLALAPSAKAVALAWSPNATHLAVLDDASALTIYDPTTGEARGSTAGGYALAWSPDGSRLASISQDTISDTISLNIIPADAPIDAMQTVLPSTNAFGTPTSLSWSPDGWSLALMRADGLLSVWENLNLQQQASQKFQVFLDQPQTPVIWSPNSSLLAFVDNSFTLRLLDGSNGKQEFAVPIKTSGLFPGTALNWLDDSHLVLLDTTLHYWFWTLEWL